MQPERWSQIEELFHRAAECDPGERVRLLDEACRTDDELRCAVEALLAGEEAARSDLHAAVSEGLDAITFPLVGTIVSHYHILEGLGGGGMGLVYRAEDIRLGRQVALKFLPDEAAKDPASLRRFEREARSASALEHPNICPIYEFGEHEGQPFLVMQLLEGKTLRELIAGGAPGQPPLELPRFLDLAHQIAEGLHAAHQHGIIHRDIKPANIFITSRGQARILDFGLAKLSASNPAEEDSGQPSLPPSAGTNTAPASSPMSTPDPLLSRTGVAMGTAGYMSPEQARGEKLDQRTDLFSFGLVLYEMATGKRAFQEITGPRLQDAILHQTPAPARRLNPNLPAQIESIIHKALEKDRENRYASASELLFDLRRLQEKSAPSRSFSWRKSLAFTGICLLLVAAGIAWILKHPASNALPDVKFRQLTINSSDNPVTFGSLSPDGNFLAFVDQQGIRIKDLQSGNTQSVALPDSLPKDRVTWELLDAAWFPDSTRFIANAHPASEAQSGWTTGTASIWTFSRSGGPPQKLRNGAYAWAVLRDGSISFATDGDRQCWLMGTDGESAHKVADSDENTRIVGPIAQSAVDRNIVLLAKTDASGDWLLSRDLRGGPTTAIFTPPEMKRIPGDFAWLPDGRLIYQAADHELGFPDPQDACNFWSLNLDLRTGRALGKPQRLTNWTGFCSAGINASADGRRLAFLKTTPGHGTGYIAQLEAGGMRISNPRHFTLEDADDAIADWTADSKSVILISNRPDHYELYKQSLTANTPRLLANIPNGANEEAFVSPDGKWVIVQTYPFSSPADPNVIARVPIDGGAPDLILKVPELRASFFCARPPAMRCVLADISEDHQRMVLSDFDPRLGRGAEITRFDFDPQFDPKVTYANWSLSPDGTRFAVGRGPAGPIQVYSFQDRSVRTIQPKGTISMLNLVWSADGKAFYFSNRTRNGMEILHMDLYGNTKLLWTNNDRTFCLPSPDGGFLAIYDWKKNNNMWMIENF